MRDISFIQPLFHLVPHVQELDLYDQSSFIHYTQTETLSLTQTDYVLDCSVDFLKKSLKVETSAFSDLLKYLDKDNGLSKLSQIVLLKRRERTEIEFSEQEMTQLTTHLHSLVKANTTLFKVKFVNNDLNSIPAGEEISKELDRRAMKHFITSGTKAPYKKVKVMFLGDGAAGKTTTLRRLLGKEFEEKHISTEVGDVNLDVIVADMHQWQEKTAKDSVIEVVSFRDHIDHQMNELSKKRIVSTNRNENKFKLLVSEESRLFRPRKRNVTLNESTRLDRSRTKVHSKRLKDVRGFNETKKDIDLTMNFWDFGGQQVFDALHHVFLTEGGMYVIIFNLVEMVLHHFDST